MKRQKKKYNRPLKPWDKANIERENKLMEEYGLRRKRELWRAESLLRNFRRTARRLEAKKDEQREKELIGRLVRIGILQDGATLDDVLALDVKDILERRLQSIVYRKGLANTMKQARQFIVHGHISVDGRRAVWPSMIVDAKSSVTFYEKSPFAKRDAK